MAVSPHEDKMIGLQRQLRHNQNDLQDFLADLGNWEDEMKEKEQELKKNPQEPQSLPPVRNSLDKKKLKKKKKKKADVQNKPKKISGFDFRSWDKFDVDKALEDIDGQDKKLSSSEYETDEEWEEERKRHLANEQKNTGNSHMTAGAHEVAVECYTKGMELDPTNALLPANRALAFIKLHRYGAAEVDSTTAISLDPLYVKAYLRRAAARVGLQHLTAALEDYQTVLQLESSNKQASAEVDRLRKEIERDTEDRKLTTSSLEKTHTSEVKAVYKPPEQRSKKPLRRIEIEEIGLKEDTERKAAIAKVEATQSRAKIEMEAKDGQLFEKFTVQSSTDTCERLESGGKVNGDSGEPGGECHSALITGVRGDKQVVSGGESGDPVSDLVRLQGDDPIKLQVRSQADGPVRSLAGDPVKSQVRSQGGPSSQSPSSPRQSESGVKGPLMREPPTTSFQLQTDLRVLKHDLPAFYTYFKRIDPGHYSKLFGKSLEPATLLTILEAVRQCCIPASEDCFHMLRSLTEVKRFSTAVMFFSAKDKQGIREIFQFLKTTAVHPHSDIDQLMEKYEV